MEFFNKAKIVKLKSHLNKYLVAGDDQETVRQSRNGSSLKARWTVELVGENSHVIRLKSCYGRYLTPSDESFLLGMTGKKVVQTIQAKKVDKSVEWEPIKENRFVKLRSKDGNFLRANGGPPPLRNTITHDVPHRMSATQDWVLWDVSVIDIDISIEEEEEEEEESTHESILSPASRFSSSPAASFSSNLAEGSRINRHSLSIVSNRSGLSSCRESGMEFFDKAKAVRLKSHLGKYLVADDDEQTVRQSRNGSSHKARWVVEFVAEKSHVIRLKSCHGLYLTASNKPFLTGLTGKKVIQTSPSTVETDSTSIEWEPVREGISLKLQTQEGKFLRANGGTPPWRNSITHDVPHRTATQNWVLWGVDVVDISLSESKSLLESVSSISSFSSYANDFAGSPDTESPPATVSGRSRDEYGRQSPGMEFFRKAKTIRLRSHHDKYLLAKDDQETVCQVGSGSSVRAKWTVEFVETVENVVRLKSCFGKYLTPVDEQVLPGMTARKVLQTVPRKLDSSVEWEPMRAGVQVRLKTRYGNFLTANGGSLPPWRNSITHDDIPNRHSDWILWDVDVVEAVHPDSPELIKRVDSMDSEPSSPSFQLQSPTLSKIESSGSFGGSPMKSNGRTIYYCVRDDYGKFNDAIEWPSFNFKGHGLDELSKKLEEETGLEDIIMCYAVNGKLYPLKLHLPPNNASMHVVIVPPSSKAARDS